MEVRFRTRRLQLCAETAAEAIRTWGPEVGQRYVRRIDELLVTERVSDLYQTRPLDFHPLTGNRRGQHAIRLNGRWRLIVTVESERSVIVEEVVNYHG